MTFRDTTDELVDAFRNLLEVNVNDALASEVGSDMYKPVASSYGMPFPRVMLPAIQLPALAVYRTASTRYDMGRHTRWRTTLRLDYLMAQTPAHSLEEVWPILHRVHQACIEAIESGELAVGGDGSNVLLDAGVQRIEEDDFGVTYDFATDAGGKNVYPMFSATLPVIHDPRSVAPAPAALPDLGTLAASLELDEGVDDLVAVLAEDESEVLTEGGLTLVTEEGIVPITLAQIEAAA